MLGDIHQAFSLNGLNSHLVFLNSSSDLPSFFDLAASLADKGQKLYHFDLNAGFAIPPSQRLSIHRLIYLIDHPFFHIERLFNCGENVTVGMIDQTHLPALADYGISLPVRFIPHGGPPLKQNSLTMDEREIDVLYCANLNNLFYKSVFDEKLKELAPISQEVALETLNRVLSGQSNIHGALRSACRDITGETLSILNLKDSVQILTLVEGLTVSLKRYDLIKTLCHIPGRNIHIVGNIPEVIDLKDLKPLPNVRIHGQRPFQDVIEMMGQAKILVNANFSISGGAHERIWQAIAAGSVLLTNESSFMRGAFSEGEDILFIPSNMADLPDIIEDYLNSPERLNRMAAQASAIYANKHQWRHRMASFISA